MEWPRDFTGELARRKEIETTILRNPLMLTGAKAMYSASPATFIADCVWLYEPRNANKGEPTRIPAVPFPRQRDFIEWLHERFITKSSAPVEKSRDSGATWIAAAFAVWVWLNFPGSSVGFGSRKEILVDQKGDIGSIFEKIRSIIRHLPPYMKPAGLNEKTHFNYMRVLNPENDASLVGEAGDNIGRGGRTSMYVIDESAFLERPQLIEASLSANTDVRIDISTPCAGSIFSTWTAASTLKFIFDVSDAPWHTKEWLKAKEDDLKSKGLGHVYRQEFLRDATAGIAGQLIPSDWVEAAVDAHVKLNIVPTGQKVAGLDVADGGQDRNALAIRFAFLLRKCVSRPDLLADAAGRWAYGESLDEGCNALQYDSIGVGAGAAAALRTAEKDKAAGKEKQRERAQRIADYLIRRARRPGAQIGSISVVDQRGQYVVAFRTRHRVVTLAPHARHDMKISGWSASHAVANPTRKYEGNRTNEDMFANAKAQAWWLLRDRFLNAYKAVVLGQTVDPDDIISLDSSIPEIRELKSELSQVTYKHNPSGKVLIEKAPDGQPSPNRADSVMIAFAPPQSKTITIHGSF